MGRPIKNMKYYEKVMREIEPNKLLKLSKLEIYKQTLTTIDRELKKAKEKYDLLSKKRDIVVNLIFEEKDKFTQRLNNPV